MSHLTGTIQFTGSLGNLSAYKLKGSDKIIIRTKGGPSKHRIKNDPSFAFTRRHNDEFGGASTTSAIIRRAQHGIKHIAEPGIAGKLSSLVYAITKLDTTNAHGERAACFSRHRQLLEGFDLNGLLLFNTVVRPPLSCSISRDSGSATLLIPALFPGIHLQVPPQYLLFRFVAVLGVIPDMVFALPKYRPAVAVRYFPETLCTNWFPAKEPFPEQTLALQLKNFTTLHNSHSLLLSLGMEFGYPVNNNLVKPIPKAGCAAIIATG